MFERLLPFLKHKEVRQRLILYLIADGYTIAELTRLTAKELRAMELKYDMDVVRDEVLDGRSSGLAFLYPNGSPVPHTAYYRLIRRAALLAVGRPFSQEKFRAYIRESD